MEIPLFNIPEWLEAAITFLIALWLAFFYFFVERIWPHLSKIGIVSFLVGIILLVIWLASGVLIALVSIFVIITFLIWWVFSGFPHKKTK